MYIAMTCVQHDTITVRAAGWGGVLQGKYVSGLCAGTIESPNSH